MIFGLVGAVILAHGSVVKAIGMIFVGLLLGTVGMDFATSVSRFTFHVAQLGDGFELAVVAMGLFGIGETITNLGRPEAARGYVRVARLWPTWQDIRSMLPAAGRGTALGCFLGVLPGGGPTLSAFSAYSMEKKFSKQPERFGRGAIEGVAAPEAANNAAAQTSFIPLLTLGLPSNAVMALMLGALMMQGLTPGPSLMHQRPELFWGLVASMWVGNLMLVILNLPLVGIWAKCLTIPYRILYPTILLICCIGVYSISNSALDVLFATGFGLCGYLFYKLGCEPALLLLGLILGPRIEENLRQALLISRGDPAVFVQRPISLTFLVLTLLLLLLLIAPSLRAQRDEAFEEG
jgi:TctA family transporter